LQVDVGWDRAVETALGDYLEAVCIDTLDELEASLAKVGSARVALLETGGALTSGSAGTLGSKVRGPQSLVALLESVRTAPSLSEALAQRRQLSAGQSVITPAGEWLGAHWLRINRGAGGHEGVIDREQRIKSLRGDFIAREMAVQELEQQLGSVRQRLSHAESQRDATQTSIQEMHRAHADLLGQLEASRARSQETAARRQRLEAESTEVARSVGETQSSLARARTELDRGLESLAALDSRQPQLEAEREQRRDTLQQNRNRAETAQLAARDLLVRVEGRRSAESSMGIALARLFEQREQLQTRSGELERELATGDAPIIDLETELQGLLAARLEVESELASARRTQEDADSELRRLDEQRLSAEQRVNETRVAMDEARLAAQETRVRRESLAEQFASTGFDLAAVIAALAAEATVPGWEQSLNDCRDDLLKLGQVNLAAIDELKENSDRKEYLDRQFADLTAALDTLEQAMRKIDKETRSRFQDTFDRVNAGLKEKFPRLFGGGHAYLELVGEDTLNAGVAIMARPPGKRNVTISQLSGGEKALTAVALVFAIFDLNPAPFCLLDEVDAPLDEHNVGRFCDIVREMAQRVQFIFITHNKATMELASQLLGVTMSEPGVSRLVSVDVDEAVRMVAS
jgi:chromosome segregation protein